MEDVIKKIIEIEEKAQRILDEVAKEKEHKYEEHQKTIHTMEEKTTQNAHRKVREIRERELKEVNEKKQAMEEACAKQWQQMDVYSQEHMEQWVQELINHVLDRE